MLVALWQTWCSSQQQHHHASPTPKQPSTLPSPPPPSQSCGHAARPHPMPHILLNPPCLRLHPQRTCQPAWHKAWRHAPSWTPGTPPPSSSRSPWTRASACTTRPGGCAWGVGCWDCVGLDAMDAMDAWRGQDCVCLPCSPALRPGMPGAHRSRTTPSPWRALPTGPLLYVAPLAAGMQPTMGRMKSMRRGSGRTEAVHGANMKAAQAL